MTDYYFTFNANCIQLDYRKTYALSYDLIFNYLLNLGSTALARVVEATVSGYFTITNNVLINIQRYFINTYIESVVQ